MKEYDLLAAWFRVADLEMEELAKNGEEGIVLKPLGQFNRAATFLVRAASQSLDLQHRKIAASLAGWIQEPPLELLDELFLQEVKRDRQLPNDDFGRIETQSVVEDIVFSAARWARSSRTRGAALELLRAIVEMTIAGEYWNSAGDAITTLNYHQAPGVEELLRRFGEFAEHPKVDHPSNPSLKGEKELTKNLLAKETQALESVESLLDLMEPWANDKNLDESSQVALEDLLHLAEQFDVS